MQGRFPSVEGPYYYYYSRHKNWAVVSSRVISIGLLLGCVVDFNIAYLLLLGTSSQNWVLDRRWQGFGPGLLFVYLWFIKWE